MSVVGAQGVERGDVDSVLLDVSLHVGRRAGRAYDVAIVGAYDLSTV